MIKKDYECELDFNKDGFRCVGIASYTKGYRCGYVAIPKGSRLFDIPTRKLESLIKVHGGVTFDRILSNFPVVTDEPMRWVGFDCNQIYDARDVSLLRLGGDPAIENFLKGMTFHANQKVRDKEFVRKQLLKMVDQLYQIETRWNRKLEYGDKGGLLGPLC